MTRRTAYTLIEMSIVLTAIGLLAGGVLAGRFLLHAAAMNSLMRDARQYSSAIQLFSDKYSALPGDMSDATSFWGVAGGDGTGVDNICSASPSTDTRTCNGNGNGVIENTPTLESLRAWQHLANAKMIQGSYLGVLGTAAGYSAAYMPGVNVPATRYEQTFYLFLVGISNAGGPNYFAANYTNSLQLFAPTSLVGHWPLWPADAYNIDKKMDDGMPGTGQVIAFKGTAAYLCTTKALAAVGADSDAQYNMDSPNQSCALYFIRAGE